MDTQQNTQLVKRYFDEVINKGNLNALDEIFDSSMTIFDTALPNQKEGLKGWKEAQNEYKRAFPDRKIKVEEIYGFDDKVVVRWTLQATHKGNLKDISPTNNSVKISGISLYTVRSGKIKEVHQQWDRLGLLEQVEEITPAAALH